MNLIIIFDSLLQWHPIMIWGLVREQPEAVTTEDNFLDSRRVFSWLS